MMRVLFRADASTHIGTGHVMRCLALAQELKVRGAACAFAMQALDGHLLREVATQGFAVVEAGADPVPAATPWDWLVTDHYGLDAAWQRAARPFTRRILAIDDLADRPLDCDLLLDQNLQEPGRYDGLVPTHAQRLLGPGFALLRPEFARLRQAPPARPQSPRVMVSFGGADEYGAALDAVDALARCALEPGQVLVVAGARNPHLEALRERCAQFGFDCLPATDRMAHCMAEASLAVGAGGTTMIERFAVSLPAVVVPIADNQRPGSAAALQAGAIALVDVSRDRRVEAIAQAVRELLGDAGGLAAMAAAAAALCDGLGARRVAERMQLQSLDLRPATARDAQQLHGWRNAPATRAHSGDGKEIAWPDHERWLAGVLGDPARGLWIAGMGEVPVGVVRFDTEGEGTTISVYLVPGTQGKGWGRALIAAGVEQARRAWPALRRIDARISPDNQASLRAFAACGFEPGGEPGAHHLMLRSPT